MGNVYSVASALKFLGADPELTSNPEVIARARRVVLPGVGSFARAMTTLRARSLDEAIRCSVTRDGHRLLGICLGMQLLGTDSTEDEPTSGLDLVPLNVRHFTDATSARVKVPHIGFARLTGLGGLKMSEGIPDSAAFYFVHSYRMTPTSRPNSVLTATAHHGTEFVAALEAGGVWGTQFHPEKSQAAGLRLLANFLRA